MAMLRETTPFSAIREARAELALSVAHASAMLSRGQSPSALGEATAALCGFGVLLSRVASVEEQLVFPRLERWISRAAPPIRRVRGMRTTVEALAGEVIKDVTVLASDPARTGGTRTTRDAVTRLMALFRDWIELEERELFALVERRMGAFSTRVLLGEIELALARPSARSR